MPTDLRNLTPEQRALLILKLRKRSAQSETQEQRIHRITPAARPDLVPLSYGQQGIWFIHQMEPNSPAYNISDGVELIGQLHVSALRRAINELVRRHEALRTNLIVIDGQPVQSIALSLDVSLPEIDLHALPKEEREQTI